MDWCCHYTRNSFDARHTYGHFTVAAMHEERNEVWFLSGYNMCHRKDNSSILSAGKAIANAIAAEGVTNVKVMEHGVVHYCQQCGVNLREHYGDDGGLLRDDEYVAELTATFDRKSDLK